MAVQSVPKGFHTVTPYLVVNGVDELIVFLEKIFNAHVIERVPGPGGATAHAEVRIGDSVVMMGQAGPQSKVMPAMMYVYVDHVDAVYHKALQHGARSVKGVANQFYGDRSGGFEDKWGNQWFVATHLEDLTGEEIAKRAKAAGRG